MSNLRSTFSVNGKSNKFEWCCLISPEVWMVPFLCSFTLSEWQKYYCQPWISNIVLQQLFVSLNEAQACSQQSNWSPKTAFTVLMQYKLLKRNILLQFIDNPFVAGGLHCSRATLLATEEIHYFQTCSVDMFCIIHGVFKNKLYHNEVI